MSDHIEFTPDEMQEILEEVDTIHTLIGSLEIDATKSANRRAKRVISSRSYLLKLIIEERIRESIPPTKKEPNQP